jgi:hypothetical protein
VGFARNTATFDGFYRPQVTDYGFLYVLFDSPPSGSNPIDVWDLCLHVQMASPKLFRSNGFSDECPAGASRKSCFDSVRDLTGTNRSPLLEIARVLARFYQIARLIANANHGIV